MKFTPPCYNITVQRIGRALSQKKKLRTSQEHNTRVKTKQEPKERYEDFISGRRADDTGSFD